MAIERLDTFGRGVLGVLVIGLLIGGGVFAYRHLTKGPSLSERTAEVTCEVQAMDQADQLPNRGHPYRATAVQRFVDLCMQNWRIEQSRGQRR